MTESIDPRGRKVLAIITGVLGAAACIYGLMFSPGAAYAGARPLALGILACGMIMLSVSANMMRKTRLAFLLLITACVLLFMWMRAS